MGGMKVPQDQWIGTVKVGEKGQIVIPKAVREIFGIEPGDALLMMADVDKGIAIVQRDTYQKFMEEVLSAPPADEPDSE